LLTLFPAFIVGPRILLSGVILLRNLHAEIARVQSNVAKIILHCDNAHASQFRALLVQNIDSRIDVAPTQSVPIVRSVEGTRHGALMRWELIPFLDRGVPTKSFRVRDVLDTQLI
jgi:hypothetical protein